MLGCKPSDNHIESSYKLQARNTASFDLGRYQRLVSKLINLSNIRPYIAYTVSLVSQYMHDPREPHLQSS